MPVPVTDLLELYDALVMEGNAPDITDFCRRYPDVPDLLQRIRALETLRADCDGLASTLAPPAETPDVVGGFRLLKEVGQGGMGVVYLAQPLAGGPRCAVKVLRRRSATGLRRFRREAELAARLSHPRLARVLAFGVEDGVAYLASEWVAGETLRRKLDVLARRQHQPQDPAISVRIAWQVAEGLAYAHTSGVVHRDVKPSNIIIAPDGKATLVDFGIARALHDTEGERLTATGAFIGTVEYAPPEQLRGDGRSMGPWSDTFALGATLYEMLTGELPFFGQSLVERCNTPDVLPPPVRRRAPKVPRVVEKLVKRALQPDIGARFADGAALAKALLTCVRKL